MDRVRIVERFTSAWNVDDPEIRRRLVEETCTESTEILSPYGEQRGIEQQLESIGQVRSQYPKLRCTPKVLGEHHGWVIDAWTTEFGGDRPPLHGIDVALIDDTGHYSKVISFSPVPPP